MPARALRLALSSIVCGLAAAAGAAGGGGDDPVPSTAEVQKAVTAIEAGRYAAAITTLRAHVARSPNDADAFNWLGFAYRKSGQLDPAFTAYRRALSIDPRHRGAHEYLGEAYLMAGQPDKAEELLQKLAALCPDGCEQRSDLQKAIAEYRAGPPKVSAR